MAQSHNCAYLDGEDRELCRADACCQYKLTTACYPLGPQICGKDQLLAIERAGGA